MTGEWHDDCWVGDPDEHHGAGAIDEQTTIRLRADLDEIERGVLDPQDPPLGARLEDIGVGIILGAALASFLFVLLLLGGKTS